MNRANLLRLPGFLRYGAQYVIHYVLQTATDLMTTLGFFLTLRGMSAFLWLEQLKADLNPEDAIAAGAKPSYPYEQPPTKDK